jgi:hypothetical protein
MAVRTSLIAGDSLTYLDCAEGASADLRCRLSQQHGSALGEQARESPPLHGVKAVAGFIL